MEANVVVTNLNVKRFYFSNSKTHALFRLCFVTVRSDLFNFHL